MNGKTKKWLSVIIILQLLILIIPTGVKTVDKSIKLRDAEVKGKQFVFTASTFSFEDDGLYISSFVCADLDRYVSRYEKLEPYPNSWGELHSKEYTGENDWYIYGEYYSATIPYEKIVFEEDYSVDGIKRRIFGRHNTTEWYFGEAYDGKYDEKEFYRIDFTATVYKGEIIPEAFYLDGVEILHTVR